MMQRHRGSRRGFTLTELIISVALLLLLMLAVNGIFGLTSQTIGAGQSLARINRDVRAVQSVIRDDFAKMATESPFMTIQSQRIGAFRNQKDQLSDFDYTPGATYGATMADTYFGTDLAMRTVDRDGNNSDGDAGDLTPVAIYNDRNRRVDVMSFFATGVFPRQTGDDGEFYADMTASEAWIKYGHLRQPNESQALNQHREQSWMPAVDVWPPTTGPFLTPETAATNPNNFYAGDWVLGRSAMLLRAPDADYRITDNAGNYQWYVGRDLTPVATSLAPLSVNSYVTEGGAGYVIDTSPGAIRVQWSRYDIAGTSMADYKSILETFIATFTTSPGNDWWSRMSYRYQGNPQPTKPITSLGAARTSPVLLQGCSQFIVEYAGDYLLQNIDPTDADPAGAGANAGVYGDILGVYWSGAAVVPTDDRTDFFVDHQGPWVSTVAYNKGNYVFWGGLWYRAAVNVAAGIEPGTGAATDIWITPATPPQRIRWYGMPRDITGDGDIPGQAPAAGPMRESEEMPDVVPLRDLWAIVDPATTGAPFERYMDLYMPRRDNYASTTEVATDDPADWTLGMHFLARYSCAWGPDTARDRRPQMVRLIITVDDPNGRLANPQTNEYVIDLP